ncbi:MAG: hydroxyphenylacetyl-CoA thioesterase PaaI [Proteobacteria bacterium]|nr:MAG: hydroxyphenylacetyl-CoA thioesterase PaaI [Pseudomonadota bacterium]QKK10810.1 MAG: hydroxyphenylacetyl-CoA thioesterase PaaI [Pseudomonadota bacterium]
MPTDQQIDYQQLGDWMAEHDRAAQALGIRLEAVGAGSCRATLTVGEEMLNAVGLTHGGVTFTLADFAFAVASNSHGRTAVALNAAITFTAASRVGDVLTATASEENCGGRTATYRVDVRNQNGELVGLFTGTVYRRNESITEHMPDAMERRSGND